jgi:hypothetical protein
VARAAQFHERRVAVKSHLTAISPGYIPREYIESIVKFINANDPVK